MKIDQKSIQEFIRETKAKKLANNQFLGLCPAHDDKNPSLSIKIANDGKLLLHCHAGCTFDAIAKAYPSIVNHAPRIQATSETSHQPATLQEFSEYTKLSINYLKQCGLTEFSNGVMIPYFTQTGDKHSRYKIRRSISSGAKYIWNSGQGETILYGLNRLATAIHHKFVVCVEGETDCLALWYHGFPALGFPGCEMTGKLKLEYLAGIPKILIIREPDKAGAGFVKGIYERCGEIGYTGEIYSLSLFPHKDALELHKANPSEFKQAFHEYLSKAAIVDPSSFTETEQAETSAGDDKKVTITEKCISILEPYILELFHDSEERTYIKYKTNGYYEISAIDSIRVKTFISHSYYTSERKPLNKEALAQVQDILKGRALFDGRKQDVYLRVGEHEGKVFYDTGKDAEFIQIDKTGWCIVQESPVPFIRSKGMLPSAMPVKSTPTLLDWVNKYIKPQRENGNILIAGWLIGCLHSSGPYPILCLNGEQGSGKSLTSRILRQIIDNCKALLRSQPRDERDLAIACQSNWVMGFDNFSTIQAWLSDSLCRVSTGGGFATRQLHTDDEEFVATYTRPIIINGITEVITKPDLLERSIVIQLSTIPKEQRKKESAILEEFENDLPYIMGSLFDCISCALRRKDEINLLDLPRMADFTAWVTAAEPALGIPDGAFMRAFNLGQQESIESNIEADCFASSLCRFMDEQSMFEWTGTAAELLQDMEEQSYVTDKMKRSREWPGNACILSRKLRRVITFMRKAGYEIEEPQSTRNKIWRITKIFSDNSSCYFTDTGEKVRVKI
jgi:hypothetical protein